MPRSVIYFCEDCRVKYGRRWSRSSPTRTVQRCGVCESLGLCWELKLGVDLEELPDGAVVTWLLELEPEPEGPQEPPTQWDRLLDDDYA